MSRVIEKSVVIEQLDRMSDKIKWEYVSPDYQVIHEHHDFVFRNPKGQEITFGFNEIYHWLYDEDYVGCGHDCDVCLTPIC